MPERSREIVNKRGDIVAKMSTIMLMWYNYARNTADACIQIAKGLVNAGIAGNVISVVAASPQGAGTHSLNRYPSPYGRLCALRHRPPFFLCKTIGYADRRGFAGIAEFGVHGFDRGGGIALSGSVKTRKTDRDTAGCSSHSYFSLRFWRFWRLQPMAIRRLSTGVSGAERVRGLRIVRLTPAAVTDSSRPSGALSRKIGPSVHPAAMAFSYAGPGANQCAGSYC